MAGKSAKKKENVRVRIAPSPTGYAHVGTAYTALFNYAFAVNSGGKFIVRIEDSDVKRNIKGAEDKIYEALNWLGISWDEGATKGGKYGPYRISERLEIYKKKAQELLDQEKAYKEEGAIRFKNPGDDVTWNDLVRGEITFPGGEITDFVIMKSDGYPTYNFNVVIDDSMMRITHVIRGEDHISNTPRQIALYKAFGLTIPQFAHHPLLMNKQRKKLSKRDAAVDVAEYKRQGYLPEAFVNFLCLLGWSHPEEKEIFPLKEFVKLFSLDRVRKSGPIFDTDKLDWMNGQYIQKLSGAEFVKRAERFAPEKADVAFLKKIAPLVKSRIKKLSELNDLLNFFFAAPKVDTKKLGENWNRHLQVAFQALEKTKVWELENINDTLMKSIDENGFKTGKFFMDLRIAITGKKITPPINESIEILGKKETISRLKDALASK
jgi:glutamyl-tRNA synthetase